MTEDLQTPAQRTTIATPAELAAAREARGMSQLDISQRIKLQTRQVAALEEGQWDALPGRAFVRGALRSYGKLIDVDVAPLLESVGAVQPEQALANDLPAHQGVPANSKSMDRGSRSSPMLWVIGGLIGVVALVLYFGADPEASKLQSWLPGGDAAPQLAGAPAGAAAGETAVAPASGSAPVAGAPVQGGAGKDSAAKGAADAAPAMGDTDRTARDAASKAEQRLKEAAAKAKADSARAAAEAEAKAAAEARAAADTKAAAEAKAAADAKAALEGRTAAEAKPTTDAQAGRESGQAGGGTAGAAAASVAAAAQAAGDTSANPASQKGMIRFTTVDDSWIEVRGKDGKALHAAVVKAGETITVQGQPPYRLTLGNAKNLVLEYEGKSRKLPAASPKNITRLALP